jgi:hypothetical protein
MAPVMNGRWTAQIDGPFVVFLIGMRVNRLYALRKWVPTMMAMGPMLRTLYAHPQKGFLGAQTFLMWRGVALVQYWRSFEALEHFARDRDDPHLEAWRRFNRTIGSDGSVGIWHETYLVGVGEYEAVYANMPVFGLAAASTHREVTGRRTTAAGRLQRQDSTQPAQEPVDALR